MPGHGSAAIAAYPSLSCFPDEPTKNYFPKNAKWAGDSVQANKCSKHGEFIVMFFVQAKKKHLNFYRM